MVCLAQLDDIIECWLLREQLSDMLIPDPQTPKAARWKNWKK